MPTVKVTDPRYGNILSTGLNGRILRIPLGQEIEADEELVTHLKDLGATVDEVGSKRAGSHQEGSGGEPAQPRKATTKPKKKAKKKAAPKKAVAKKPETKTAEATNSAPVLKRLFGRSGPHEEVRDEKH